MSMPISNFLRTIYLVKRIGLCDGIGNFFGGLLGHVLQAQLGVMSYAGLTPKIRQSGSSVNARSRISKMGNPKLRNVLFMCSFNACNYNRAYKAEWSLKGKAKN